MSNLEKDQFVFQKRSIFIQTNSFKFLDFDSIKFDSHFKIMKKIPGNSLKIMEISWNFVKKIKWVLD